MYVYVFSFVYVRFRFYPSRLICDLVKFGTIGACVRLSGCCSYASDAYAIFCEGRWREVSPQDHMLVKYWKWLDETGGAGMGFQNILEPSSEALGEVCPSSEAQQTSVAKFDDV